MDMKQLDMVRALRARYPKLGLKPCKRALVVAGWDPEKAGVAATAPAVANLATVVATDFDSFLAMKIQAVENRPDIAARNIPREAIVAAMEQADWIISDALETLSRIVPEKPAQQVTEEATDPEPEQVADRKATAPEPADDQPPANIVKPAKRGKK